MHQKLVELVSTANLPTLWGEFKIHAFRELKRKREHIALVFGSISKERPTLVRVHSRCLTGDVFGSLRCDCQEQLHLAIKAIVKNKSGVLVYLNQEGRDIGIIDKIKSYALQDKGYDTVEANRVLGYKPDMRDYNVGAQILKELGVSSMKLLTNNPAKIKGIEEYGLKIVLRIPLEIESNKYNHKYLSTKRDKLGHLLH